MNELEFKKINKDINKANRRLQRLQKFSGKDVSWAGHNLMSKLNNEKLGAWSNDNLIQISKSMSDEQLERVYRATKIFLNSRTSLIKGVRNAIKETVRSIGGNLDVSKEEAESLYRSLSEDTFKWANRYAEASRIWATIEEAKEFGFTNKRFRDRMLDIMQIENDKDVSNNIRTLYEKYVKE